MTKQLAHWKLFRKFQTARRANFFPYTQQVEVRLARRHGFKFPPSLRTLEGGLKEEPSRQGKLATWVEYLYYEHDRLSGYEGLMHDLEPQYLAAWAKLVGSRSLSRTEARTQSPLELCYPQSLQDAGRDWGKRALGDFMRIWGENRDTGWRTADQGTISPARRRYENDEAQRSRHEAATLNQMEKRTRMISDCRQNIESYRLAHGKVDLQRVLVQWVKDQVPLILKEEDDLRRASIILKRAQRVDCLFAPFLCLPPELRYNIWTYNLAPRPTAHFFDVLNHPRLHKVQHWNPVEFRVTASQDHDSGYLAVYALLAVCRESRLVVGGYYRHLQADRGGDSPAWYYPFTIFQTFDWIPADDLVVLCFPPKHKPLPERNAFSLARGPARHVGIRFPKEMLMIALLKRYGMWNHGPHLDDETQINMVPAFLMNLLQPRDRETAGQPGDTKHPLNSDGGGGGIKKLYLLCDSWHARGYHYVNPQWEGPEFTSAERSEWLEASQKPGIQWGFHEVRDRSTAPWRAITTQVRERKLRDHYSDLPDPAWWWVGSGTNAVRGHDPDEKAEAEAAEEIERWAEGIRGSREWRSISGCEGVEVLGWVVDGEEGEGS